MSSMIVLVGTRIAPDLAHRVAALVVQVGAVLDGPHAGPQRRHDARLAVAVRRDHPVGEPGDLHDGPQLRPS